MKLKILVILLILSLAGVAAGLWLAQKFHIENTSLKDKIKELEIENVNTKKELKDKEREVTRLLSDLERKSKQLFSLEEKMEEEKKAREEIAFLLEKQKVELAKEKERSLELENELNKGKIEFKHLLTRISDLESKKTDLEKRLLEKKPKEPEIKKTTSVELGKIEVKGEQRETEEQEETEEQRETDVMKLSERLEGKVLVVNREYEFAVINLGESDGLGTSDILSVYQDEEFLGNVKVEESRDRMAVVTLLDAEVRDKIKEGDLIIFPFQ